MLHSINFKSLALVSINVKNSKQFLEDVLLGSSSLSVSEIYVLWRQLYAKDPSTIRGQTPHQQPSSSPMESSPAKYLTRYCRTLERANAIFTVLCKEHEVISHNQQWRLSKWGERWMVPSWFPLRHPLPSTWSPALDIAEVGRSAWD
jgi:hypothetical protein